MNEQSNPKGCYAFLMRIRRLSHSTYELKYHIVWGTKYRRKILKPYVKKVLLESINQTLSLHPDWYLHTVNTDQDHVHLLMEIPPSETISDVVRMLKVESNFHLRKHFPFIRRIYTRRGSVWSTGYFVSSVGMNEKKIESYITKQGHLDSGTDVSAEFERQTTRNPG